MVNPNPPSGGSSPPPPPNPPKPPKPPRMVGPINGSRFMNYNGGMVNIRNITGTFRSSGLVYDKTLDPEVTGNKNDRFWDLVSKLRLVYKNTGNGTVDERLDRTSIRNIALNYPIFHTIDRAGRYRLKTSNVNQVDFPDPFNVEVLSVANGDARVLEFHTGILEIDTTYNPHNLSDDEILEVLDVIKKSSKVIAPDYEGTRSVVSRNESSNRYGLLYDIKTLYVLDGDILYLEGDIEPTYLMNGAARDENYGGNPNLVNIRTAMLYLESLDEDEGTEDITLEVDDINVYNDSNNRFWELVDKLNITYRTDDTYDTTGLSTNGMKLNKNNLLSIYGYGSKYSKMITYLDGNNIPESGRKHFLKGYNRNDRNDKTTITDRYFKSFTVKVTNEQVMPSPSDWFGSKAMYMRYTGELRIDTSGPIPEGITENMIKKIFKLIIEVSDRYKESDAVKLIDSTFRSTIGYAGRPEYRPLIDYPEYVISHMIYEGEGDQT